MDMQSPSNRPAGRISITEETAGKRTPGALPSKILPPHLPETEGTGPSSTAVAPLGAGGATSRNLSVTVSFLSSGWSIKEITRSTASHALGCISFRASLTALQAVHVNSSVWASACFITGARIMP